MRISRSLSIISTQKHVAQVYECKTQRLGLHCQISQERLTSLLISRNDYFTINNLCTQIMELFIVTAVSQLNTHFYHRFATQINSKNYIQLLNGETVTQTGAIQRIYN